MRILMISSDKKILEKGSAVRWRMMGYGSVLDELHIIVFTLKSPKSGTLNLTGNVWVYPTNSYSHWLYIFDAIKTGRRIIGNSRNEIIVSCQDPFEAGFVGWIFKIRFKLRLQLQAHTDFLSKHFAHGVLNKVRVHLARFLLPRADCVRVVSRRIKNSITSKMEIPDSKFQVLPIFVDVEKIYDTEPISDLHKKYPQFEFIVLLASRLTYEKNIRLALKALRQVVRRYRRVGLVIVGDGPLKKDLQLKARKWGLEKNVIFEPWTEDISSYYKTADMFLLTSDYEGYGRTLIEAAVAGCPIVATNVGIIGEVFSHGETALVCDPRDTLCVINHIRSLRADVHMRHRLASRARDAAFRNAQKDRGAYLKRFRDILNQCALKHQNES